MLVRSKMLALLCIALRLDIWPKINALAFHLGLRNQMGWVQLGLASD